MHHFAGTPPIGYDINQWLRNQENAHVNQGFTGGIGYHYIIAEDGTIYQGRPDGVIGAHTGGNNINTIGISFIGTFTQGMPTQSALDSAVWLVDDIRSRYAINAAYAHSQMPGHTGRGDFAENLEMLDWINGLISDECGGGG
jgi:hypothetical protein